MSLVHITAFIYNFYFGRLWSFSSFLLRLYPFFSCEILLCSQDFWEKGKSVFRTQWPLGYEAHALPLSCNWCPKSFPKLQSFYYYIGLMAPRRCRPTTRTGLTRGPPSWSGPTALCEKARRSTGSGTVRSSTPTPRARGRARETRRPGSTASWSLPRSCTTRYCVVSCCRLLPVVAGPFNLSKLLSQVPSKICVRWLKKANFITMTTLPVSIVAKWSIIVWIGAIMTISLKVHPIDQSIKLDHVSQSFSLISFHLNWFKEGLDATFFLACTWCCGLMDKALACSAGDPDSIPAVAKSSNLP